MIKKGKEAAEKEPEQKQLETTAKGKSQKTE